MKVNLIYPSPPENEGTLDSARSGSLDVLSRLLRRLANLGLTSYMPPLSLLMLAAVTPPDVEVQVIDERVDALDLDDPVDLVGITATTWAVSRAREIAAAYRKRGVTVVAGGIHPSVLPEEALQYADVVVIGEGEKAWPRVLSDYQRKSLEPVYQREPIRDLDELPFPRREVIRNPERYLTMKVLAATRGCPNRCTFCSCGHATGKRYRKRSVENVVAELDQVPGKYAFFVDDSLTWDTDYAKRLFREIVPLGIKWAGYSTLPALEDDELLELLAESGCVSLGLGFESISPQVIANIGKEQTNEPARYRALIERAHAVGIPIQGFFIVGFDDDDAGTFEALARFIDETCIEMPSLRTLVPYPGSPIYRQFAREGRILTEDWDHYHERGSRVVYRPKQMTPEELAEGYVTMLERVFSLGSIFRRLWGAGNLSIKSIGRLVINLGSRRMAARLRADLERATSLETLAQEEPQ